MMPAVEWDCKYHVVFIPKKSRQIIFGAIRKHLGRVFYELARQKGIVIEEGHLMPDHVHMCLSLPPKFSVSNIVGFLKVKVLFQLPRPSKVGKEISMVKHFG
ncbi:MAG: putative transposase [Arenicella sp.]|jgi:putative transposase